MKVMIFQKSSESETPEGIRRRKRIEDVETVTALGEKVVFIYPHAEGDTMAEKIASVISQASACDKVMFMLGSDKTPLGAVLIPFCKNSKIIIDREMYRK